MKNSFISIIDKLILEEIQNNNVSLTPELETTIEKIFEKNPNLKDRFQRLNDQDKSEFLISFISNLEIEEEDADTILNKTKNNINGEEDENPFSPAS